MKVNLILLLVFALTIYPILELTYVIVEYSELYEAVGIMFFKGELVFMWGAYIALFPLLKYCLKK